MTQSRPRDRQRGAAPLAIVVIVAAVVLMLVVTVNALSAYKTSIARQGWDEVMGEHADMKFVLFQDCTEEAMISRIQATKMVINNTTGMTSMTTMAGRSARNASQTRTNTQKVAIKSLKSNSETLSLADLP